MGALFTFFGRSNIEDGGDGEEGGGLLARVVDDDGEEFNEEEGDTACRRCL